MYEHEHYNNGRTSANGFASGLAFTVVMGRIQGDSRRPSSGLRSGGLTMTIASWRSCQKATLREVPASNDVRTLIANHLDVDVKRVTDEAHFTDDLGADWLDGLELMIVIEDRFAHVVITDEDVDQIEVIGDLIRHIKNVD